MNRFILLEDQFYIENQKIFSSENSSLSVEDQTQTEGNLVSVSRTVKNIGETEISFIPCISVQTENAVDGWFVPSVSYSGNHFGDGMEPKGLLCENEPWIFPSDHMGVPGCTVVMGKQGCSALFLSNQDIRSACSLEISNEAVIQRVFFTHIEYPKAYLEKFRYGDAVLNAVTLAPQESLTLHAKLFLCENEGIFGYRPFIEFLLTKWARPAVSRDKPEIYEYSMSFLRRLLERVGEDTLTNMGFIPNPQKKIPEIPHSEFVYRKSGRYECGWCGQNISNAFLLLFDEAEKQNFKLKQKTPIAPFDMAFALEGCFNTENTDFKDALSILDTWQKYRFPNGLFPVLLDHVFRGRTEFSLDLCNLGWLAYQYLNCHILLQNGGVERTDYLESARGVLDALLHYPSLAKGFPQTVNEKGEILCDLGMAGGMMTVAALQMYRITGEEKYFSAGKESFDFYYDHYLSKNAAAGGALDTYCIDKESAGPILRAALLLERLTGDASYLEKAENIASYLQTWMFYYDIPFPENTDAAKTGFTTFGATAVSAQHHHLDCWASFYIPDFRYLAERTKHTVWKYAADALREYTFGGISDGKTELHGFLRPAGAQNEAIFQSDWSFDGKNKKGEFNDWLVSWVNAFRLMDIDHLKLQKRQNFPLA